MSNQPFTLSTNSKKNGIYLSQQQVDLLIIVSLKDKNEIKRYIEEKCSQFPNKKAEDIVDLEHSSIEECKRQLFDKYKDSLVTYLENDTYSEVEKAQAKLSKLGLNAEQISQVTEQLKNGGRESTFNFIRQVYGEEFVTQFSHLMFDDFENIKDESVTYELISQLNKQIREDKSIDTIIIATGKYGNSMSQAGTDVKFDPYLTSKGLEYCRDTHKHMRYHALIDYAHFTKLLEDGYGLDDHDKVLAELKSFVQQSISFIKENNDRMPDGSMRINVIEVFNELVEYNKPENAKAQYDMVWQKYFGISVEELMSCFKDDEGKDIGKPEGVSYMYNETMLEESSVRRDIVETVLSQIMKTNPNFLDKFGDQMHLEQLHAIQNTEKTPYGKMNELNEAFDLLKRIQDMGLSIECTEFDIHIDSTTMEKVANMLKDGRITEQQILEMKRTWIDSISKLAESKGITFDRTSYWSILDAIDHNVVRANIQRQKDGKEPFETVYAGLYGDGKNLGKLNDVQKNISSIRESAVEATESMTRSENITSSFDNIKKITQDLTQEQSLDTNEVDKE